MGDVNLSFRFIKRSRATGKDADAGVEQPPAAAKSDDASAQQGAEQGATVAQASSKEGHDASEHVCPNCEAPMADGQEWCTQCGERSGGSMRKRAGWASAGAITAVSAILASGAAAAGVAALTQGTAKEPPHQSILAQRPATTATVPPATPPAAVNPGSPETLKSSHPPAATHATTTTTHSQSIAATPATHTPASTGAGSGGSSGTGSSQGASTTESHQTSTTKSAGAETPELQGLTASAYTLNPLYSKSSLEGPENDPSRALEGPESGTSWTVQIKPGSSENINVGLLIALGGPTRVGSLEVHTSTPGFPLEIYGTASGQPPTTITAWQRLARTPSLKASATLKLGSTGTHMRYVLLWVPKAPASMHHVALGEVALYPPTS
jgi:hypothetical protein